MSFVSRGKTVNEQILNLKQMDTATCASLKGHMNEYGECLVKAKESPEDPDIVILEVLKYKKPGAEVRRQGE